MTTITTPRGTAGRSRPVAALHRTYALARAEVVLLRRNRALLFTALGLPVALVAVMATVGSDELTTRAGAAAAVGVLLSTQLLLVVYYCVLSASVARREEGVLQRLRTGEARDAEILAALSAPTAVLSIMQIVLLAALAIVVVDLPLPRNPLLVLAALLLGIAVFAILALLTAIWSRTVESAQITSLPVLFVSLLGSGITVPFSALPDPLATVARFLPMTPIVESAGDGWSGAGGVGSTLSALAIALAWVVAGSLLLRTSFRWSPRV